MKNSVFISLFVIFSLFSGICYAQWVQVPNGMGNLQVVSLSSSGNNIFAGTSAGVYLSVNNGENWTSTSLPGYTFWALAANGINVFAGTFNGVYSSTNNGTNWTQTSLNNRDVLALAVNGNTVFAGTFSYPSFYGVYKSTNNGGSWTQTSLNNRDVIALAVNGNNIFAGTYFDGVYKSTNNGTSWTQTSLNNQGVYSLAVNGNNIFAGTSYNNPPVGVYKSTNNGTNWTQTLFLNNQYVFALAVSGVNIFAGADGVYVSNDNGTIWIQRNEGLDYNNVRSLCIINNYIFAGTDGNSVYRRPLSDLIGIQSISNEVPNQFSLSQNYPNPFNPITKIRFALPKSSFARLVIYDALGREAETLVKEQLNAGTYEADWSADKFSSGVYYYKLTVHQGGSTSGDFAETKKMILIK